MGWLTCAAVTAVGLALSWANFYGKLRGDIWSETYGLTTGMVMPLLLGSALACYYVSARLRHG
jgi:peptidoglycan/LPS O-acetylase OafA/YrhL